MIRSTSALPAIGLAAVALAGCGAGGAIAKLEATGKGNAGTAALKSSLAPKRVRRPTSTPSTPSSANRPTSMPPASAGTNGSFVPPASAPRERIVPRIHEALGQPGGPTATLLGGIALAPAGAPEAIRGVISAANEIVGRPYVLGGGHGSWYSRGYDCSGAVSFALFGGGLIPKPLTSSQLESWGVPGPGHWLTVYANATHAYAVIAGLRWDTVGDANGTGPKWHPYDAYPRGFVARHAPGY